jgi:hypothetical protein
MSTVLRTLVGLFGTLCSAQRRTAVARVGSDLDGGAGVELGITEPVRVAQQLLHPEHVLPACRLCHRDCLGGHRRAGRGGPPQHPQQRTRLRRGHLATGGVGGRGKAVQDPRDRVLLGVLYGGGLHVSEHAGLTWSDVVARDKEQVQLSVLGKGGIARQVLLPETVNRALLSLRRDAGANDPIFASRKTDARLTERAVLG